MKKLFTFAMAATLGLSAYAQDPSTWTNGQDVTTQIQWKAYDASQEDPANPVWKGFSYAEDGSGNFEFRPFGVTSLDVPPTTGEENACPAENFISWGVYNEPTWKVYQEFEIPAGLYTVSVAGCYREGQTGVTFDLWAAGKKTTNCYLFVKVGDNVYQTPMMYMFEGAQTTALYNAGAGGWTADCKFTHPKTQETIYGPSCHSGADNYIENGNYNWNEVTFVVPEKTTITVGIDKQTVMAQDQAWWNHWKMTFERPYDETAEAYLAYQNFDKAKEEAISFTDNVCDQYPVLGALMRDEVSEIGDDIDPKDCTKEEVAAAVAELEAAVANNEIAFTKAKTMEYVLGVCEGTAKATDYPGKAAFEEAIAMAKKVLADEEFETYQDIEGFIAQAEALSKARIAYISSQEKAQDGSIDFTHAISTPWFINQEYTPTYAWTSDAGVPVYNFPEPVEADYFGGSAPGDEKVNLENGKYGEEANNEPSWTEKMPYAISDQAHWSTDKSVTNRWIYEDTWGGWHGGMQNYVMKLKGYPAWYSGWSAEANPNGSMEVRQVVTDLPEGFYTIEGRVFAQADKFEECGDQYLFIRDAEGNDVVKVQNTQSRGFWDFWDRQSWITLKSDYVQIKGGTVTIGYHHNMMAGNSGVVLKYFGEELDYSGMVQAKIDELKAKIDQAVNESKIWGGDVKAINEKIATVVLPIQGADAFTEANAIIAEANNDFNNASKAAQGYNIPDKYLSLQNSYDANEDVVAIIDPAWTATMEIGEGENDSYTMIAPAQAIYNAYESYVRAYDKAGEYNNAEMDAVLKKQYADLSKNYANVETLVAYEKEISTIINKAIFEERGSKEASETNKMDITDMLANADLSEGPKTGWTCEGEDVNPGINTYGRQVAECWNQKPFTISQTLRSLPAGAYEFSVRACYRDGSAVDQAMIDRQTAGEGLNAVIFADNGKTTCEDFIKGTAVLKHTDPSFTTWWDCHDDETYVNMGFMKDWDGTICILEEEKDVIDEDSYVTCIKEIDLASPSYPFDTKVGEYYFPSSMAGFQYVIKNDSEAYCNTIQIMVEEGGDLTVGLSKKLAENADWLIYDDFKLYYLGTEVPTGIANVNTQSAKQVIFNLAGQRLNAPQKGINIINGKKVFIK